MEPAGAAAPPPPSSNGREHTHARRSDEQRAADRARRARWAARAARVGLPLLVLAALAAAWEWLVPVLKPAPTALPAPSLVLEALGRHGESLARAAAATAGIAALGLAIAALAGALLAVAFALSRWVEAALRPLALAVQAAPVVALAPLVLWQADTTAAALVISTALVAFYPFAAQTTRALANTDPRLRELYALYEATSWQRLRLLLVPGALPGLLHGLRGAAALAPAAALTAEFVALAVGATVSPAGLATPLLQAIQGHDVALLWATLAVAALLAIVFIGLGALAAPRTEPRHGSHAGAMASWRDGEMA
jgi:NitT/TauT family transport system permease protein